MVQNGVEYMPTPAEERLLKVLADTGNWGKTKTEKARMCECDPATITRAYQKPGFCRLANETLTRALMDDTEQIIAAAAKVARDGGASGHMDRKMLLEMAGLYKNKQEIKADIRTTASRIAGMSDEELDEELEELLHKRSGQQESTDQDQPES